MTRPATGWTDELLDAVRRRGDPVADQTADMIRSGGLGAVAEANRLLARIGTNACAPDFTGVSSPVANALREYFDRTSALPPWTDRTRLERAERLFFDHGLLSVVTLYYASLPECYVVPSLAKVLHVAGQLEAHTDRRIRETARMIFTVMADGGLTAPTGTGIRNVQRVRLIHAMIRREILRGNPAEVMEVGGALAQRRNGATDWHGAYAALGWDMDGDGMPVNQEELAFTLLTFSYIALRSFRQLGVGLSQEDEDAYLHCWNVVGYVLGIAYELTADTMTEAHELFERIKARALERPAPVPDPRLPLTAALITMLQREFVRGPLRPIAVMLPRTLLGAQTTRLLGIHAQASPLAWTAFACLIGCIRALEALGRLLARDFGLVRLLHRVIAHDVLENLLLHESRPLWLPAGVLNPLITSWQRDARHPAALNWIEAKLSAQPTASLSSART